MGRLKTFLKYGLLILGLWILSDILIFVGVNSTYKEKAYTILGNNDNYELNIEECKATYVNGYVKGKIKSNEENNVQDKYVKINCYSPRDVLLGTKYVQIQNLMPNQSREFEMYYKFENVERCTVELVDEAPKDATREQFLSEEASYWFIITTLVYMCIV